MYHSSQSAAIQLSGTPYHLTRFLRVFEWCGVVPLVSSLQFCVCVSDGPQWFPPAVIHVLPYGSPVCSCHLELFTCSILLSSPCASSPLAALALAAPLSTLLVGEFRTCKSSFSCSHSRVRVRLGHHVIVRSLCSSLVGEGVLTQTSALMCGLSLVFFVCLVHVLPL